MNLLLIIDTQFDVSLARTQWIEIIKNLQNNFHIYIATGFRKEKIKVKGLKSIFYISSIKLPFINRLTFYFNQIRYFNSLVKKYSPHIILFNSNNYLLLKKAVALKSLYRFKIYLDIRTLPVWSSNLKNLIDYYFLKQSLRIASSYFDGITYITEEMKRYLKEKYNLPKHRSEGWTSGVNTEIFKPLNIPKKESTFRLIYHGHIAKNRGINNVVKALEILRDYDIEFFIIGSGEASYELKNLIGKLGLGNRVILHPPVSYKQIPEYISCADVGILTLPNWSGWNVSSPIKLFEYLACGKPVIVTKIPAHINVLKGKDFAFWSKSSNPEDIAKAILKAYENRVNFLQIGKESRCFVQSKYTWYKQAKKLEDFLLNN